MERLPVEMHTLFLINIFIFLIFTDANYRSQIITRDWIYVKTIRESELCEMQFYTIKVSWSDVVCSLLLSPV